MNGDEVSLGEQSRAELHVVLEVERARHLKLGAEGVDDSRLVELLHAADTAELLVRVLGHGQPRRPPVATAMVVVRRARNGGGRLCVVVEVVI